jgi:PKD repeat protein
VETRNGGKSEIFGDFSYTTTHVTPGAMFVNNESSVFAEITEVCYTGQPFDNVIQETRGGQTITVSRSQDWVAPYIGHTNQNGGLPPAADFSCTATSGLVPLMVTFTDASTNNPIDWAWDFGDGTVSAERNPSHQYAWPGQYTVTLTAANGYGTNTISGEIVATVPALRVFQTATNTIVVSWSGPSVWMGTAADQRAGGRTLDQADRERAA